MALSVSLGLAPGSDPAHPQGPGNQVLERCIRGPALSGKPRQPTHPQQACRAPRPLASHPHRAPQGTTRRAERLPRVPSRVSLECDPGSTQLPLIPPEAEAAARDAFPHPQGLSSKCSRHPPPTPLTLASLTPFLWLPLPLCPRPLLFLLQAPPLAISQPPPTPHTPPRFLRTPSRPCRPFPPLCLKFWRDLSTNGEVSPLGHRSALIRFGKASSLPPPARPQAGPIAPEQVRKR